MKRFLPLVLLLSLTLPGFSAEKAPEVVMYLQDGTDVTGRLTTVTNDTLTLVTAKGKTEVSRKKYQGMVLNTPEQKKVADRVTTDPMAMITYGQYTKASRDTLKNALAKSMPTDQCPAKTLNADQPVAHLEIDKRGHVKKALLLNASRCAKLDAALLKNIRAVKMGPLPKDHPFSSHTLNYFYSVPPSVAKKTAKKAN